MIVPDRFRRGVSSNGGNARVVIPRGATIPMVRALSLSRSRAALILYIKAHCITSTGKRPDLTRYDFC